MSRSHAKKGNVTERRNWGGITELSIMPKALTWTLLTTSIVDECETE